MEYRLTTNEDYPELVTWWKWFRFEPPKIEMLPNNMLDGVIISENGVNIFAGFIYRTPSAFCFMEFIVSNPAIKDRKLRKEALSLLIGVISQLAKKMGFKLIYSSIKNESLINHYLDNGFVKGSLNCTEMIKIIE